MTKTKKKGGRPKGSTKTRLNIYKKELKVLIEYMDNQTNKKVFSRNNIKKAFYLLYFFGFRQGELTLLTVKDIKDMVKFKKISLKNNTKSKRAREAYISDKNAIFLAELFHDELLQDDRYALLKPWNSPMEQYSPKALSNILNKVIKEALGEQYSTHSFRAGYITTLHRAGISIPVIKEIIGHTSSATTMRYIKVDEVEKREAVKIIDILI